VHLADPADRRRVVAAGEGADNLVNTTGIIRRRPIFEATLEDLHSSFAVNVEREEI
jgi:NAD(P)-dependent dehydrogenase (short-subunit alcohol dehydrogenase family)